MDVKNRHFLFKEFCPETEAGRHNWELSKRKRR